MKRIGRLVAMAVVFLPLLAAKVWERLAAFISRKDPLDNIGLFLSPVVRFYHQQGLKICTALALVAVTALPGSAMPVFDFNGVFRFGVTAGAGLATIGGAIMGATKEDTRLPFRFGTVRRRIPIGAFTLTPGSQLPAVTIPQVGMMSRVLFDINGTYTVAVAPLVLLNLDGFDALIARAQVLLNNGSANIVDVSGLGIRTINENLNTALPIKKGTPLAAGNVNGTQFPLAIGASTFAYRGILPVNANQRRQFEMGLINLQAPELRATINMSFNPLSYLVTVPGNLTLFAATVALSYEYYEIPDPTQYRLPPLTLLRTIEEAPVSITAVGEQTYQLPRLGTMIEYHAVLVLNRVYSPVIAATSGVTEFKVRYNKTDVQYQVFIGDWETYEAELYGIGISVLQAPTPTAATPVTRWQMDPFALSFNLWAAGDVNINGGDFRDAIDTEEQTTTETITTIRAGTVLTPGTDYLYHVRRVVQRVVPVQAPAA